MKTRSLIGGMSWESTIPYDRIINETVRERMGGLYSARRILYSMDFADIERRQQAGAWEEAGTLLADVARALEAAEAEGRASVYEHDADLTRGGSAKPMIRA